jgi:transposase InsO family protein
MSRYVDEHRDRFWSSRSARPWACRCPPTTTGELVGDPHERGLVFFAFVLDACSRMIVGWQLAGHMRTDLVLDALHMALHRRVPPVGPISSSAASGPRRSRSGSKRLISVLRYGSIVVA